MVMGFLANNMTIESLRLPYACENCNHEITYLAVRGKDYEYPAAGLSEKVQVPENLECPKCKQVKVEPDFFIGKTFKFLKGA